MDFSQVHDWLDKFEDEVCENKKKIRGRIFSGMRLEIYDRTEVVIVLETAIEGSCPESRTMSMIKEIMDTRVLEAFIPYDRFVNIVNGTDELREEDWRWDDEQF